ncbi:MAG: DUF3177 family protein [Cyanobacteria bacterium P01_F01_bin.53]
MLGTLTAVRSLAWTDYRLALLFAVFIPLTLLIWSWVKRAEAISMMLTIYWRVASLLAITVYLMIGGFSVSFVTALLAKILIPLSLWFWVDLNEEIREQPKRSLNLGFNVWRWAITAYCAVGAIIQLFYVRCAFSSTMLTSDSCQAWIEPSLVYKDYIHGGLTRPFLGFWGIVGLVIYAAYLGYFLLVRLGRQGRSALNQ